MLPDHEWLSNLPHKAFNLHIYNTKKQINKLKGKKEMKPSNRIFFFLHCPFSHATQSHILKFPQFQSYTRLHCFPAHLWGVRLSKSAHQAPSITIPGKSGTAKQNSFEMPPQALLPVPWSATFHLCHIPLAGCKNALCLVSGVSCLTYRSVTPRSSLLVNRGEPHIDHPQNQNPSVPAN